MEWKSMLKPKAFVTGATGFVGTSLCAELISQGWDVTALVRSTAMPGLLINAGVKVAQGDILSRSSLISAMPEAVDAVFHTAGDTSLWRKKDAQQTRLNVEGTRNVIEACAFRDAGRLVHTSTLSAFGFHEFVIDEYTTSYAMSSTINYERSKWLAEEEVRQAMRDGLSAVILSPAAILGPGDIHNWARIFVLLRRGLLPFLPKGLISFNHVSEIAKAHVSAATRGLPGETYLLGGDSASIADMVTIASELLQIRPPRLRVDTKLLKALGHILAALTPANFDEPLMTPESVHMMSAKQLCSSEKAKRDLGYRTVPLRQCLNESYQWLCQEKRL